MSVQIYDKASWQIDNGLIKESVINHFQFIFSWLMKNNLLSKDGLEVYEIGIDDSISLNDKLLNEKGQLFIKEFYDNYIETINYGEIENEMLLQKMFDEWEKNQLYNF